MSVPDSAGKEIQRYNQIPSPKVQGLLQNLKFIVYMTPISNPDQKEAYQKYHEMTAPAAQLNKFGHPKLKRYINMEVETIEYVNLRSEERYLYKTEVSVALPGQEERAKVRHVTFQVTAYSLSLNKVARLQKAILLSLVCLKCSV
ncbi:hypothetical protein [Psychrosphaera algicola]|uniref:Uncharacterized protein n=1 Tax=Psychrosphaera algicola TaxID=3023714 RepID=A0ABT5FA22_9GAMM|nr:hypothetical protein [Psychrosphaera sp. G1-22]MDC2888251.1 hypothetical protein [Psychrosphaera sp. G1-22]